MANIYIASKDVLNVGEHSYWVFDPDDNPYNANERIIRGGNTNTDIFIIDPLEYLIEVDRPIINSRDTLNLYDSSKQNIIGTADPFSDRNYTTVLSGNLDSVQAVWDRMVADARTYGTLVSDPWTSDEGGFINPDTAAYILPETLYGLLSSNCNCFTNTIGFAGGIDFSNHIPLDGGDLGSGVPVEEIQFTGLDGVFLSYGDGVFQFDDRIVSTFDQGGNDTYIYDFANTNTLQTKVIHEDTNIGTFDRIILTNINADEVKFARDLDGDLRIYYNDNQNASIIIENQFDDVVAKIGYIWVYQNNGEGPVALSLNNPDDFVLLYENTQTGDVNAETSSNWFADDQPTASEENKIISIEESIQLPTLSGTGVYQFVGTAFGKSLLGVKVETLVQIIKHGTKNDQIGASWKLYEAVMENGTYDPNTGVKTLEGVSIQQIDNNYGGYAELVSYNGQALNVLTKYQHDFQQQVLEVLGSDGRTTSAQITVVDGLVNQVYGGEPIKITYPENYVFEKIGGYVGDLIGQQVANGNVYHDLIYSAAIKTLSQNTGALLDFLATGENSLLESIFDPLFGTNGTNLQRPDIFDDLLINLQGGILSTVSGLISSELGDAIEIDGIGGEIFDVVSGTVTTGFVQAGLSEFGLVFNGLDGGVYSKLFASGFEFDAIYNPTAPVEAQTTIGDQIQLQVYNALGAYAASRLAGEVIEAESEQAVILGSIGSTLGSYVGSAIATEAIIVSQAVSKIFSSIGTTFAPVVGTAIGAFIGQIAGTFIGNLFGDDDPDPASWARMSFNRETGDFEITQNWGQDGLDASISAKMANAALGGINEVIDLTFGALRASSSSPQVMIGMDDGQFAVSYNGGTRYFGNSGDAIQFAAFKALKNFDLVGGHAVLMRAWHNSEATNLAEFQEDIEVAEAFQNYLMNPTAILALMMDQPDSELAQSWAAILQRAAEMELHLPHERDIDGGWGELLRARGDIDPSLIPDIEGDSIVLTDPVTGEETVLHHVIGPGYEIIRIEGTDGNDFSEVIVDGPSISHVDAGAGDDTIIGSDQRDIIVGGDGNDTIDGNDGDDWIHGGAGNDNIDGNGGLDLIYGGDDDDYLVGGTDDDEIYGGAGNDTIYGALGKDVLYGGEGDDFLQGDGGYDIMKGGEGNDYLVGQGGDKLYGGKGDDTFDLLATSNNQIWISRGDGHDILQPPSPALHKTNYLIFDETIGGNEINAHYSGNDLILTVLGENQSVTIKNFATNYYFQILTNGGDIKLDLISDIGYKHFFSGIPTGEEGIISDGARGLSEQNYYQRATHDGASTPPPPFYGSPSLGQYRYEHTTLNVSNSGAALSYNSLGIRPDLFVDDPNSATTFGPYVTGSPAAIAYGGAQDDVMYSTGQDDGGVRYDTYQLFGDSGNDTLYGNNLWDILVGGLGNDTLYGYGGDDKLYGGAGNDTIYASNGDDLVDGGYGNDKIYGHAGNDTIHGAAGIDDINGGTGDDEIYGGEGDDRLLGAEGSDTINGGDGNDLISGDSDDDALFGGTGNDTIEGGSGDDLLHGDAGSDTLRGQGGNDLVYGGVGNDNINGGDGHDTLFGNEGSDTIRGGSGNDEMHGDEGDDHLYGDDGNDTLIGGIGNDILEGGSGDDTYVFKTGDGVNTITETSGFDTIRLDSAIQLEDITFNQIGNDLSIEIASGFLVKDFYSGDDGKLVEQILFDDGSTFDLTTLLALANQDPDAQDDSFTLDEDGTLNGNLLASNGNGADSDPDGDTLTVSPQQITTAAGGTLDLLANGDFTYTPASEFSGSDSFTYTLLDGKGGTDTATVTLTINPVDDAPEVLNNGAEIDEDGTLLLTSSMLSAADNDTSPTGRLFRLQSAPSNGTLYLNNVALIIAATFTQQDILDGLVSYKPDANYNGADDFDFTLEDGTTTLGTQTFNINVSPVNDDPDAQNDAASTNQNEALIIDLLSNDSDIDADSTSVESVTQGTNGSVAVNGDGTVTYTPNDGFNGSDSFNYTISDGNGGSDTATVDITVMAAPEENDPEAGPAPEAPDENVAFILDSVDTTTLLDSDAVNTADYYAEKTLAVSFETGDNIYARQVIYEQGNSYRGLNIFIEGGELYIAAWNRYGQYWGYKSIDTDIDANTKYTATMVLDGSYYRNGTLTGYLNGEQFDDVGGVGYLYRHSGNVGIGMMDDGAVFHGGSRYGNGYTFQGNIEKIASYNDALEGETLDQLHNYMAHEWLDGTSSVVENNTAPVAMDDFFSTSHDYLFGNLLDNNGEEADYDPDGDDLSVKSGEFRTENGGWVWIDDDGDFEYEADYGDDNEFDSFTYTLYDEHGKSDTATAYIEITNDYYDDEYGYYDDEEDDHYYGYYDDDENEYENYYDDDEEADPDAITGTWGNDNLYGTNGEDKLYGYGGNDTLSGEGGEDRLYGGSGADTFVLDNLNGVDRIQDFNLAEGDKIDLSDILEAYDPLNDAITDFVQITNSGENSYLAVDTNGGGDNFVKIAVIDNAIGLTNEEALELNGTLIVA